MTNDEETVLQEVIRQLHKIGSANDAEDHHYLAEAQRMRAEALAALRDILRENEFLARRSPDLPRMLDTDQLFTVGWWQILKGLESGEG